jgi:septum formation protein
LAAAAARLYAMQGRAHRLVNGLSVAHNGEIVTRHSSAATLHMRPMTKLDIDQYLDAAGAGVLNSVGAYEVEALGGRLFERIDGDFFTVLGLPLFPLLAFLRQGGAIAW